MRRGLVVSARWTTRGPCERTMITEGSNDQIHGPKILSGNNICCKRVRIQFKQLTQSHLRGVRVSEDPYVRGLFWINGHSVYGQWIVVRTCG